MIYLKHLCRPIAPTLSAFKRVEKRDIFIGIAHASQIQEGLSMASGAQSHPPPPGYRGGDQCLRALLPLHPPLYREFLSQEDGLPYHLPDPNSSSLCPPAYALPPLSQGDRSGLQAILPLPGAGSLCPHPAERSALHRLHERTCRAD